MREFGGPFPTKGRLRAGAAASGGERLKFPVCSWRDGCQLGRMDQLGRLTANGVTRTSRKLEPRGWAVVRSGPRRACAERVGSQLCNWLPRAAVGCEGPIAQLRVRGALLVAARTSRWSAAWAEHAERGTSI